MKLAVPKLASPHACPYYDARLRRPLHALLLQQQGVLGNGVAAGAQLLGATSSVTAGDGGGNRTLLVCFIALGLTEPLHDGAPPLLQHGILAYGVAAWLLAIAPVGVIAEVGGVEAILLAHARAPSVCATLAPFHRRCRLSAAAQRIDNLTCIVLF